jgi:zinc transport system permease protein
MTINPMFAVFQYDFVVRGIEAGLLIAAIAPLIGMFLVLRRYSLIADTLAHVSLAGVAVGLLLNINPLWSALGISTVSSVVIERLRLSKKVYGETALSLFLSGGLALAVVLIGIAHGFNVDLFSYLFGSIVTVKHSDIRSIMVLSVLIALTIAAVYKELVATSFDEDAARVGGIPTQALNTVFIILAAATIAVAIPVIGILLVSALLVIPVVTALQLRVSFAKTLLWAELFSLSSVFIGIIVSFYANLPSGGTIVLIMLGMFALMLAARSMHTRMQRRRVHV